MPREHSHTAGQHQHDHGHQHQHDHSQHAHGVKPDADRRYLTIALALIIGFMAFEIIVGVVAHSLALLSDAGHMLTDAGALVLSLFVIRLVQQPVGGKMTYGMRRAEVLSGQANGAVLLVLGVLVIYEAIWRLVRPPDVAAGLMTGVAAVGVVINILAAWILAKANRQSLNVEGSFQHIITDLYAFVGTFIAGVVILMTGFDRADAIASIFVAVLMIRSGVQLQRRALSVLLESAPEDLLPEAVGEAMVRTALVEQVHDLHVWELVPGHPLLSAHVLVGPKADCHAVRRSLEQMLREQFRIDHTTLQVDHMHDPVIRLRRER